VTVLRKCIIVDRFPKAVIAVNGFISQCGGGEAAALVMAAGQALLHARIDMRFLPSAAIVVCLTSS
jgi:ribonuclease PH